ncbi:MAG: CdaR family protein [Blastocatellia bacterium]|nr:CdaR family protein [Blastocatellia bacterium]
MKSRLLNRAPHIENLGLKALALLLAALLFAISRQPISEVRLTGIQIEYRGRSQGVEIINDPEQTVSLRLRGPRGVVRNLLSNQLSVIADLAGKEPGDRTVQLSVDDSALPDNTSVLQIEPSSIRIRLEQTIKKSVPVEARVSGQVAEGWEVYAMRYEPQTAEIEGPRSLVEKTPQVLTETVSLTGRRETFQSRVEVETLAGSLRILAPRQVTLTVEIDERRMVRRFANLPIQWLDQPAGGRLAQKTVDVEVFGPQSKIQQMSPDQLRVELKTADLPAGTDLAAPRVQLPANAGEHIFVKQIFPREVKVKR